MGCQNERLHKEMLELGCYIDTTRRCIKLSDDGDLCIGGVFVIGEIESIVKAMEKVLRDA